MKILYLCPWPLYADKYKSTEDAGTTFGYYTMVKDGVDISCYTPSRKSKIKLWLWNKKPHLFGAVFTQLGCLRLTRNYDVIYIGFDMHLLPLTIAKCLGLCRKPIFVLSHFTYNSNYIESRWKRLFIKAERYMVFRYIDRISFASEQLKNIAFEGGVLR